MQIECYCDRPCERYYTNENADRRTYRPINVKKINKQINKLLLLLARLKQVKIFIIRILRCHHSTLNCAYMICIYA